MIDSRPHLHRSDIVIVAFPFTDLSGSKRRPAIVIGMGANRSDVLLAFISSVIPDEPSSCDVALRPSMAGFSQTGLKTASVLRLNKLATIERRLITRRIGHLPSQYIAQLDDALVNAVGINLERYIKDEHQR